MLLYTKAHESITMSKKYTKLPRGMTWDDVNASIRRRKFLKELKTPTKKSDWVTALTHDGTDFEIKTNKRTGDFWVSHG